MRLEGLPDGGCSLWWRNGRAGQERRVITFPLKLMGPFSQSIGRFLYDPVTNWQGAFSPSFVFNANPQDAPIEGHVLSRTGSYGKQ